MTEQIDYDPNTVLEALNNKADRDLNNVTDGTYQVLTTKNITNCITKIPQDIKLEATDTTVILKSGSKVYDGNGPLSTLSSDSISTVSMSAGTKLVFYEENRNTTVGFLEARCGSGGSLPADSTDYDIFYLITDKKIYRYNITSSVWDSSLEYSLPICRIVTDGSKITSLKSFNGFGYISSTIFALPGVEGLMPNGRNTDGSLNNTKFTTTNVITANVDGTYPAYFVLNSNSIESLGTGETAYNQANNTLTFRGGKKLCCIFANAQINSGRITLFNPKTTFQAIDRNNKEEIISWCMPDYSAGINVTYPYTAPSDGVIIASPQFRGGETTVMYIDDVQIFYMYGANPSYDSKHFIMPINKGNKVTISRAYAAGGDKFYPLKGEI